MKDEFVISTETQALNIPWVIARLKDSYWGAWLKPEQISEAIHNSLCFGMYRIVDGKRKTQVGFARVVTDGVTFSSVMDVYIECGYRQKGLGSTLMKSVMAHPEISKTICVLSTKDAHRFYRKFGFANVSVMKHDPVP